MISVNESGRVVGELSAVLDRNQWRSLKTLCQRAHLGFEGRFEAAGSQLRFFTITWPLFFPPVGFSTEDLQQFYTLAGLAQCKAEELVLIVCTSQHAFFALRNLKDEEKLKFVELILDQRKSVLLQDLNQIVELWESLPELCQSRFFQIAFRSRFLPNSFDAKGAQSLKNQAFHAGVLKTLLQVKTPVLFSQLPKNFILWLLSRENLALINLSAAEQLVLLDLVLALNSKKFPELDLQNIARNLAVNCNDALLNQNIFERHGRLVCYLVNETRQSIRPTEDQALVILQDALQIFVDQNQDEDTHFFAELRRNMELFIKTPEDFFSLLDLDYAGDDLDDEAEDFRPRDDYSYKYLACDILFENGFFERCLDSKDRASIFKIFCLMSHGQRSKLMSLLVKKNLLGIFETNEDQIGLLTLSRGEGDDGSWVLFEKLIQNGFFSAIIKTRDDLFCYFKYLTHEQSRVLVDALDKANLLETIASTPGARREFFSVTKAFRCLPFAHFMILISGLTQDQRCNLFHYLDGQDSDFMDSQVADIETRFNLKSIVHFRARRVEKYLALASYALENPATKIARFIQDQRIKQKKSPRRTVRLRGPAYLEILNQLPIEVYPLYIGNLGRIPELVRCSSAKSYLAFQAKITNPELRQWVFHYAIEARMLERISQSGKDFCFIVRSFSFEQRVLFFQTYPHKREEMKSELKIRLMLFGVDDAAQKEDILAFNLASNFEQNFAALTASLLPFNPDLPSTSSQLFANLLDLSPEKISQRLDLLVKTAAAEGDTALLKIFADFNLKDLHEFLLGASNAQIEVLVSHSEFRSYLVSFVSCSDLINLGHHDRKAEIFHIFAQTHIFRAYIHDKNSLYELLKQISTDEFVDLQIPRAVLSDVVQASNWQPLLNSKLDEEKYEYSEFVDVLRQAVADLPLWRTVALLRSCGVESTQNFGVQLWSISTARKEEWRYELTKFRALYGKFRIGIGKGFVKNIEGDAGNIEGAYWKIVEHALQGDKKSASNEALRQMADDDLSSRSSIRLFDLSARSGTEGNGAVSAVYRDFDL